MIRNLIGYAAVAAAFGRGRGIGVDAGFGRETRQVVGVDAVGLDGRASIDEPCVPPVRGDVLVDRRESRSQRVVTGGRRRREHDRDVVPGEERGESVGVGTVLGVVGLTVEGASGRRVLHARRQRVPAELGYYDLDPASHDLTVEIGHPVAYRRAAEHHRLGVPSAVGTDREDERRLGLPRQ